MNAPIINLLWTGGWDSTYRLLDAVLSEGRTVQPYYVIDPDRRSHKKEMEVHRQILNEIAVRYPEERQRIRDPILILKGDLAENHAIQSAISRLKQHGRLSSQYEWLARMAVERNLHTLELGVHVDDTAHPFIVGNDLPDDVQTVFGRFSFPLLNMTKVDMEASARRHGFLDILEMTWFCENAGPLPCGLCLPCQFAMKEGMGRRLPIRARLRYRRNQSPLYRSIRSRIRILDRFFSKSE